MSYDNSDLGLLTLAEAATILRVSKRTLLRMIQKKDIPAFKVGGQWRLREVVFRKWVSKLEEGEKKHEAR